MQALPPRLSRVLICLGVVVGCFAATAASPPAPREEPAAVALNPLQQRILAVADELLNGYAISYVYGGHTVAEANHCQECNACLMAKEAKPTQRLRLCPVCKQCSLDCSHFTQLVYERSGLKQPYLPTASMLALSATALQQRFRLTSLAGLEAAAPGDLLVYEGHVVLLERKLASGRGDIIHATGGRAIRKPGEGIQRERNILLASFRGPLRRILRPAELATPDPVKPTAVRGGAASQQGQGVGRLIPIKKRQQSAN